MGYVETYPLKRKVCGLVVAVNQKSWHYCKLAPFHKGGCKA